VLDSGLGNEATQGDAVMKKKAKAVVARTAGELAEVLGLERATVSKLR
jgi:hypothetical protein